MESHLLCNTSAESSSSETDEKIWRGLSDVVKDFLNVIFSIVLYLTKLVTVSSFLIFLETCIVCMWWHNHVIQWNDLFELLARYPIYGGI